MNDYAPRERRSFIRSSAGWIIALALALVTLISNYSANATRITVNNERIEKLEANTITRAEFNDVIRRLDRIETKVDQVRSSKKGRDNE